MLIAVAGSIGAGKSTVARAIAETFDIPLHSIDDDKLAIGATTASFAEWVASGTPFPDSFRAEVFRRTLQCLESMRAVSPHVIVEETFHRKSIRDPFFDRGGSLLGGFSLIEVVVDESKVMERLARRAEIETGHMAGVDMYRSFQAVSDPQDRVDHVFRNDGDFERELDACCRYILDKIAPAHGSAVSGTP